jgi:hypothetical protein
VLLDATAGLPARTKGPFHEIIVVSVFSFEFLLRLVAAENRIALVLENGPR